MFFDRVMPNLFWQFLVFLRREGVLQFRYIKSLLLDLFLVLLAGGVLGGLYAEVRFKISSFLSPSFIEQVQDVPKNCSIFD